MLSCMGRTRSKNCFLYLGQAAVSFSTRDEVCPIVLDQPEKVMPGLRILALGGIEGEMKKSGPPPQSHAESARLTRRNKLLRAVFFNDKVGSENTEPAVRADDALCTET